MTNDNIFLAQINELESQELIREFDEWSTLSESQAKNADALLNHFGSDLELV